MTQSWLLSVPLGDPSMYQGLKVAVAADGCSSIDGRLAAMKGLSTPTQFQGFR